MGDGRLELADGPLVLGDRHSLFNRLRLEGPVAAADDVHPDVVDQDGRQDQTQGHPGDGQRLQGPPGEA